MGQVADWLESTSAIEELESGLCEKGRVGARFYTPSGNREAPPPRAISRVEPTLGHGVLERGK